MLRQTKSANVTVEDMLQMIQSGDKQLESNLSSLFGNIHGTRQYWFSRQGEIHCLMREFGPDWPHSGFGRIGNILRYDVLRRI